MRHAIAKFNSTEITFSDRIATVKPSAVREIFKHTANPEVIPFALGNPDARAFPAEKIAEISAQLLKDEPVNCLQYSVTEGFDKLREIIKEQAADKGEFYYKNDDLIVTAGAQQAIDAVTKILCNEGDTIITESPSFVGSLNTFRTYRANLVGIPLDNEGMIPEALEKVLKSYKENHRQDKIAFIYTIPTFQNPSGITMPAERRKNILNLVYKYEAFLLEDNPYGQVYFDKAPPRSFKAIELAQKISEQRVIFAGSFSKTISPGLRVGYLSAAKEVIQKAVISLQATTVHSNIWSQKVINEILRNKKFYSEHLDNIRSIYKEKRDLAVNSLKKLLPPEVSITEPDGGFFLWITLPEKVNINDFVASLLKKKVAVVPGNAFSANDTDKTNSVRICYATPTEEQIVKGIDVFAETAKAFLYK